MPPPEESQEQIYIVDAEDRVIGSKPRNSIDFTRDIYRVAALWITNSRCQVLLAQGRLDRAKDPGKWGSAAAGTVAVGETYESNMAEESQEEIGLTGCAFTLGPKQYVDRPRKYFMQWFTCRLDWPSDAFHPNPKEVERVEWIDKERLLAEIVTQPDKFVPALPDALNLL